MNQQTPYDRGWSDGYRDLPQLDSHPGESAERREYDRGYAEGQSQGKEDLWEKRMSACRP